MIFLACKVTFKSVFYIRYLLNEVGDQNVPSGDQNFPISRQLALEQKKLIWSPEPPLPGNRTNPYLSQKIPLVEFLATFFELLSHCIAFLMEATCVIFTVPWRCDCYPKSCIMNISKRSFFM